ncbi:UDP-glucose/GDP-mannose dehydrogenase family protein [Streptomyces bambusae]|uniref:UDP-glucose dehydrogenase family protein n=1 Tax=Streptomyces bambusae TaxID=1550616 RepID=UPI001CFFDD7E|nr:UDP-glucose/GDP-mannose dehydrogenase family protein [Streptomyces bambusae]MCB5169927.1 UDP-glucose/GDP-mannose dehydrogenase family protein [Streptomyces bambusae]
MKLSVVGCGRLGAPYAASLAQIGHEVMGVDTDPAQLAALKDGRAPFDEPGLDDLIAGLSRDGLLRFSHAGYDALDHADIVFVCVPTPQQTDSEEADLTALTAAVLDLAGQATRDTLIIAKSSVPVGTCAALDREIQERVQPGVRVTLGFSPDFLRESTSVADAAKPTRIILGVPDKDDRVERTLRAVWQPWLDMGVPLVVTNRATAELAKSAANAFLATKISYINAMAALCEKTGADITTLATSLAHDPRIGPAMLAPGAGFGGSCIPKDIRALYAKAAQLGVPEGRLFRQVDAINCRRRRRTVELTRQQAGGTLTGSRITVWGAAFKPGTDDLRDSPALAIALDLVAEGAHVVVHDPMALPHITAHHPQLTTAEDPLRAAAGAQILLHLTEWPQYRSINPADVAAVMDTPRIIDARTVLDRTAWEAAGFHHLALGTQTTTN